MVEAVDIVDERFDKLTTRRNDAYLFEVDFSLDQNAD